MSTLESTLLSSTKEAFEKLADVTPRQERLNLFKQQNSSGETILHVLAGTKNRERILWALECVDPEDRRKLLLIQTLDGQTVFHLLGYGAQIQLIISALDLVNISDIPELLQCVNTQGDTIAHSLAKCGSRRPIPLITKLLKMIPKDAGLPLLKITNSSQLTVLHLCIQNEDLELASCFVKSVEKRLRQQLFKQQTQKGQTVMHMAVEKNNEVLLEQLINLLP